MTTTDFPLLGLINRPAGPFFRGAFVGFLFLGAVFTLEY